MKWLICRCKNTNQLLVVSRRSRELLLDLWSDKKIIVPSIVVKEFESLDEVEHYFKELKAVDDLIESVLEN